MSRTKNNYDQPATHSISRDPDRDIGSHSDTNNVFPHEMLNTQLIDSIPGGDIACMRRLITKGANPNATCCLNHVTACHIAAMHDNDALDLLLRSGADGFRSDTQGRTPLHFAAWTGNVKQIASLLNFPEDLRKRVEDYVLFISSAVDEVKKHCAPVNEFINKRCHPQVELTLADGWRDGVDHTHRTVLELLPPVQPGWTALHAASARAQHHCVQLLLAAGADTSAQDLLCRTPLDVAGYAHYNGHKIHVNNFVETVDILLKTGGKFLKSCVEKTNTPLHTAVELESAAAVEYMLQGGASATAWNSQGLTAMHVCVKKRNKGLLQLLANHKSIDAIQYLATVDTKDEMGSTVLCAAVKAEWIEGVCIALRAGATNMKASTETPMNYCLIEEILQEYNPLMHRLIFDDDYDDDEVPSFTQLRSDETSVLHLAVKLGSKDILEYLLQYPYKNTNTTKLINTSDRFGPPLFYAVIYNLPDCARLLISKGAEVIPLMHCNDFHCHNIISNNNIAWTSLLHIAVIKNHYEIAEMIIRHDSETVHFVVMGRSPLHDACSRGNKKMIELLVRNGADLSGGRNVNESYYMAKQGKLVPIELLMNNVSKPTEFMQEIFDSCITSNGQEYCEVHVNYRVLFPKRGMKHMGVIKALINTGNAYNQHSLLLHPLVQSFLYPKWRSLLPLFYSIVALDVCFVLSLNVFALSLFWYKDRKIEPVPNIFRSSVWICIIYLTTFLIMIKEIITTVGRYFLLTESVFALSRCVSITLAVILTGIMSWDSEPNPEWVRIFGSATLLLSWVRIMFLLSNLPDYGYHVLIYGKMATKVIKILVSFGFLIFGFSVCFMIQFHGQPPFENPWSSFLITMVMMTSEFGYNEIINEKSKNEGLTNLTMIRLTFVSFLILVSIVLMNFLISVAVNDVDKLLKSRNIMTLEKQVEFITSFEITGYNLFKKIIPRGLYERWVKKRQWENSIFLHPLRRDTRSNGYSLPNHLRKAIFEKAQARKKQSDDEQATMLYQMKLDEIHKVIVEKAGTVPPKPDGPDNALMMKLDEILTVIVKKDATKPPKSDGPDNALMMKLDEILTVIVKKDATEPPKSEGPDNALMMKLDEIHTVIVKKDATVPPKSEGPDNALMMKLDEIHTVIVKKDATVPPKSESPDNALMMKLDEIHTVIVKKDATVPPKSEGPDNALMMKLDEIHTVIVKKDATEPPKSEGPDNALMMKLDEIHTVIVKKDATEPPIPTHSV